MCGSFLCVHGATLSEGDGSARFLPAIVDKSILATLAGKSLSQDQIDLLHTGACIRILGRFGAAVGNHQHVRIYAVNQDDARKTVEAFIEVLKEVYTTAQYFKSRQLELQENIAKGRKDITEKEVKLKSTQARLEELKKSVYYTSRDEAKQIVLELNKTVNTLDVEIAGLQAKISAIEKYKSDKKTDAETLAKLEAMLGEQVVELAGALAKKEVATRIRDQAQEYYRLNIVEIDLLNVTHNLKTNLSNFESELQQVENQLAQAVEDVRQPKVFQNKVTIYPVRVEE